MKINQKSYKCVITAVFPQLASEYDYSGIVQIDGDKLIVYLEYDLDNNTFKYREELQLFDSQSNHFYLKIRTAQSFFIQYFTCFKCYCLSAFISATTPDGSVMSPFGNTGLLEIHCNSWIENVLCDDILEKYWNEVRIEYKFLENWSDLPSGSYTFVINEHVNLSITIEYVQFHNKFPPQDINKKTVMISLFSNQYESLQYFTEFSNNFFLFIRSATDISIPAGKIILFHGTDYLDDSNIGCILHFRSAYDDVVEESPSIMKLMSIPLPLSKLIEHKDCFKNWYNCCDKCRSSLSLYINSITDKYFINQRIIFLVQVFDGLHNYICPETIVAPELFSTWKDIVIKTAEETATSLDINILNAKARMEGILSSFNKNSLKSRISNFISENYHDNTQITRLGGVQHITKILTDLRHGYAHGNSKLPSSIDGTYLYSLWIFMKEIDRILITKYIILIS